MKKMIGMKEKNMDDKSKWILNDWLKQIDILKGEFGSFSNINIIKGPCEIIAFGGAIWMEISTSCFVVATFFSGSFVYYRKTCW